MKKLKIFKAFFLVAALSLTLTGCGNLTEGETNTEIVENGKVAVSLSARENYRTILSALPENISYSLKVEDKSEATEANPKEADIEKTGLSLAALPTVYVTAGKKYAFTLTGYTVEGEGETAQKKNLLSGTEEVTVSSESTSVTIKLGSVTNKDVKLKLALKVKAGGSVLDADGMASYGITKISAGLYDAEPSTEGASGSPLSLDENYNISGTVKSGAVKWLKVELKDSADKVLGSKVESLYAIAESDIDSSLSVNLRQYKATFKYTTSATSAPVVSLKNKDLESAEIITLTTASTASPFIYSDYIPLGNYDVISGGKNLGTINSVKEVDCNDKISLEGLSLSWKDGNQPLIYAAETAEASLKSALVVKASMKEGDKPAEDKEVSEYILSDFDATSSAEQTVTVSYSYNGVTKTSTIKVSLKAVELESIAVKTAPGKTVYYVGDATSDIDLTGLVLELTNNDGSKGEVEYSERNKNDFAAVLDTTAAGTKNLTVTYKEKKAEIEVTVKALFTKFDAADLTSGDIKGSEETPAIESDDKTWKLTVANGKKVQSKEGTFVTYDYNEENGSGYKWTKRLAFNKQGAENASLKLLVGAGKTVVLRVDGGHADSLNSYTADKPAAVFTFTGKETVTWSPKVSLATTYVTLVGDADGYVTVKCSSTDVNGNIYGITKVDNAVDISAQKVTANIVTYSNPVITLAETADLAGASSVDLTATVATPTSSTVTYTASVNGETVSKSDAVIADLSDVTITYAWKKDGTAIEGAKNATYSATASGTYTLTASYKAADKNTYSGEARCEVSDSAAAQVTVTFNANGGTITTSTQSVYSGNATPITTASSLGLSREGYKFVGWATSENGEKTYADGGNINVTEAITLYALWTENNGTSVYELDFSKLTSLSAGTKGTFSALNQSTIFFSDSLKTEGVKWTAKSNSIPSDFTKPSKGLTLSSGKMAVSSEKLQNAVKIVTTGAATLTAYVTVQTSGKNLKLDVYDADNKSIKDTTGVTYTFDGESKTLGAVVESSVSTLTLHAITVTLPAAGTYYLGDTGDGKIQYGYLAVEM